MRGLKRCFETISRKFAVELLSSNPELLKLQQESNEAQSINDSEKYPAEEYPTILSSQTIEQLSLPVLDLTLKSNQLSVLKKYLGVPSFDASLDSRKKLNFPPGERREMIAHTHLFFPFSSSGIVNIMSVGGFVGYIMKIECVFDSSQTIDKKGDFTSTGNL